VEIIDRAPGIRSYIFEVDVEVCCCRRRCLSPPFAESLATGEELRLPPRLFCQDGLHGWLNTARVPNHSQINDAGDTVRRSYTIVSLAEDAPRFELCVKEEEHGVCSGYLASQTKAGFTGKVLRWVSSP
jgi:hypothetical protein